MATHLGHHAGGMLDATYDIHSHKYVDPADQIIVRRIKALHTRFHTWSRPGSRSTINCKGPMAATIAYMTEWNWQAQALHRWTPPATQLLMENEISIQEKLEKTLLQEARSQRITQLAQRPRHHHLITGLDWRVYHQQIKRLPNERRTHLKTWVQGAVQFREDGKPKQCPICGVPATPKHILWLCKWRQGQGHKPAWAERITRHDEVPRAWNLAGPTGAGSPSASGMG